MHTDDSHCLQTNPWSFRSVCLQGRTKFKPVYGSLRGGMVVELNFGGLLRLPGPLPPPTVLSCPRGWPPPSQEWAAASFFLWRDRVPSSAGRAVILQGRLARHCPLISSPGFRLSACY